MATGFLYWGHRHRLKLMDDQAEPRKLSAGRFCLQRDPAGDDRQQFIRWYSERGRDCPTNKVNALANRLEVTPAGVKVQDLGYRQGSCGKGGWLYFHWKTIFLPRSIAEYVVIHELTHLHAPPPAPCTGVLAERAMPDHEHRKPLLAEHGMDAEEI